MGVPPAEDMGINPLTLPVGVKPMSEQKRLDRPDREKIAVFLCDVVRDANWQDINDKEKAVFRLEAAQILALIIPDIEKRIKKQAQDTIKGIEEMYEKDEANVIEEAKKQERERVRKSFFGWLTVDSETHDARRKEFNQAIFDAKEGWAVFNGTDLDMVMEKFNKALQGLEEG